jgi:hypothetical protein
MWDLWWTKQHWGKYSPSTSVSFAKHSTHCSTLIIIIIIIIIITIWVGRTGHLVASVIADSALFYPKKQYKKKLQIFYA